MKFSQKVLLLKFKLRNFSIKFIVEERKAKIKNKIFSTMKTHAEHASNRDGNPFDVWISAVDIRVSSLLRI